MLSQKMRRYAKITAAVLSAVIAITSSSVVVCAAGIEYSDDRGQNRLNNEDIASKSAEPKKPVFKSSESDEQEISPNLDETAKSQDTIEDTSEETSEIGITIYEQTDMSENSDQNKGKSDKTEAADVFDDGSFDKNEGADIHETGDVQIIEHYEADDNILITEADKFREKSSENSQESIEDNRDLVLYSTYSENCSFKEADGISFQYCVGTAWTDFYGRTDVLDHIDGVRIQSTRKPYYLQYHTKDVGKDNYRPFVTSEEDDYAGWYGISMSQLEIQVFLQDGRRIYDDYIVMYRVKVNGRG